MRITFLFLLCGALSLSGGGCFLALDHATADEDIAEFIALPRDFEGYTGWPSVVVGETPAAPPHDAAVRRVYLSMLPDDGETSFPVGTIVVKTGAGAEAGTSDSDEVHAMVKRGGQFNAAGARGWEWFELAAHTDAPAVVWRGANPPSGESYGCTPGAACTETASCNGCHASSAANDFVKSTPLQLDALDVSLVRAFAAGSQP